VNWRLLGVRDGEVDRTLLLFSGDNFFQFGIIELLE
jgi:hypothetical protein